MRRLPASGEKDFTFYSKLRCIRKPLLAGTDGGSPSGGCCVRRPACASGFQGCANKREALPRSELSGARRGPRLPASSHRLGFPPRSGFCPFRVSFAGATAGGRGGRPEKTMGTFAEPRASGGGPRDHLQGAFFHPSPVSDVPARVGHPSHRRPGPGSEGRGQCCPRSEGKGFLFQF